MLDLLLLSQQCAPTVHAGTVQRIVSVESSFNPYAIGVVGAQLARQPRSLEEAISAARWLQAKGANFSVGLMQINIRNFSAHGLTLSNAFDTCVNLRAGSLILETCFRRARRHMSSDQQALRAALSCYESGNFKTGFRDGYVAKVVSPVARLRKKELPKISATVSSAPDGRGASLSNIVVTKRNSNSQPETNALLS